MKSFEPSKELLNEVVPHGENSIEDIELIGNELSVLYRVGGWSYYNIYELMHMMKEWLRDLGYQVSINILEDGIYINVGKFGYGYIHYSPCYKTEFEAVTKACEWILKEETK